MKKNVLYYIALVALLFTGITSCQDDDSISSTGYLRLNIGVNTGVDVQTRAEYNPQQLAVKIVNAAGTTVQSWDDYTEIGSDQIALSPGQYTVYASSNGFDGASSGFNMPYYAGSTTVTITAKKEVTATITCTLANVEVTVDFDESIQSAFKSAICVITSAQSGVDGLSFIMGKDTQPAYFPVADLTASLVVENNEGVTHTLEYTITGVAARDYYKITYTMAESGNTNITVAIDNGETVYRYTFNISLSSTTTLMANEANAWSNFANLSGYVLSTSEDLDTSKMKFQYKLEEADEWTDWKADYASYTYTAKLTGLTPSTTYNYRLCYVDGDVEYDSDAQTFTTEDATALVNGNMDDWYKNSIWYPISESYYTANGGSFWDTSNKGTSLAGITNTKQESETVHTSSGSSAKLESVYAFIKFAAASLYTGEFNSLVSTRGAKIDFGQPFTDRPTQFRGWYQYSTGTMDYVGSGTPGNCVKGTTLDLFSVYIALSTEMKQVDNTDTSTFLDLENDDDIIAYAQLPDEDCVSTNGEWKEFVLDLKYKSLTKKPKYIIICCSSSKYGDYFTGSTSSVLYVDDLDLVYGDEPQTVD